MCPSEERSKTETKNRETFYMSNMHPQLQGLNSGTWKSLEIYEQNSARLGWEMYIIAGCYGSLGRIKDKVTIPKRCFKIVVLLPKGNNDLNRIDEDTRVIAVDMPNDGTHVPGWRNHRVTVDEIENATGLDFLSEIPDEIEDVLESTVNQD
jgi:endonuclease G